MKQICLSVVRRIMVNVHKEWARTTNIHCSEYLLLLWVLHPYPESHLVLVINNKMHFEQMSSFCACTAGSPETRQQKLVAFWHILNDGLLKPFPWA